MQSINSVELGAAVCEFQLNSDVVMSLNIPENYPQEHKPKEVAQHFLLG